jgi:DNA-binding NarL/FixJ family response regulator
MREERAMPGPLRVLLADDHPMVRETLSRYVGKLAAETAVAEAENLHEALERARLASFDLIILDLHMPGMDGLNGLQRMREAAPQIPIVILTGSTEPEHVARAFELGAAGFIPKTMVGRAMVNALRMVMNGERFVPAAPHIRPDRRGDSAEHSLLGRLTPQQRRVLDLLVDGRSNKEIARALGIEEITVKVHLRGVFRTLGVTNRTQAATRALQLGLLRAVRG